MTTFNAFPLPAANGTIAVTSTSQRIALQGTGGAVLLQNVGAAECFVAVGDATVVAVAGGAATAASDGAVSVPAGAIVIYSIPPDAGYLAAVCASGSTTTLRVSRGDGG
jgi:hypothetical protein